MVGGREACIDLPPLPPLAPCAWPETERLTWRMEHWHRTDE